MNKWLNFGGDPDHGSESGSRHWYKTFLGGCTVPVLLVIVIIIISSSSWG